MNLSINPDPADATAAPQKSTSHNVGGKFLFTRSFDGDAASLAAEAMRNAPTPMVTLSVAEFEGAKAESYAAGVRAGRAEAAEDQNALLAEAIARLTVALQQLASATNTQQARTLETVALSVKAIAQKALPHYFQQHGLDEIEKLVSETLQQLKEEPRLVVRVADQQLDACISRLNGLAARAAYEGKLVIMADSTLAASDCRIEWADGGLERLEQHLWASLEQALSHRLGKVHPQLEQYHKTPAITPVTTETGATHDHIE